LSTLRNSIFKQPRRKRLWARHCERKRSNPSSREKKVWIASSLPLLAMTAETSADSNFKQHCLQIQLRDLAACSREFCFDIPLISEGAGNAGRPSRPQPRVQNKKAHERSHHGHAGSPDIPYAMVLTVSFVLASARLCPAIDVFCSPGKGRRGCRDQVRA
jgi:hypothetical protein